MKCFIWIVDGWLVSIYEYHRSVLLCFKLSVYEHEQLIEVKKERIFKL